MEKNNISIVSILQVVNSVPLQEILDVALKVTKIMPFPPASTVIITLLKILVKIQKVLSSFVVQDEDINTSVSSEVLRNTIERAFQDGVLSDKEKSDIKKKAASLKLDVDELMSNLEDLEDIAKQAVADGVLTPEEIQEMSEQAKLCKIDAKKFLEITNERLSKQISK